MKIPKTEELKMFIINNRTICKTHSMQLDEIRQGNSHIYNLRQTLLLNNFQINLSLG